MERIMQRFRMSEEQKEKFVVSAVSLFFLLSLCFSAGLDSYLILTDEPIL